MKTSVSRVAARIKKQWPVWLTLAAILLTATAGKLSGTVTGQVNADQTIYLRYADQNPANGWEALHAAQPWLKQIEESTRGRVRIQPYFSEDLIKGANSWNAVKNDVVDMAWMFHGYWADQTPLANVISLPLLPFTSARQSSAIFWRLYEQFPTLREEFQDNQILVVWASTPYFLVTVNRQVKQAEDLKGLKIRVSDGQPVKILQSLGAVPITISMPDTYLYLQKGLIDGVVTSWEGLVSFHQYELSTYYTYLPLFTVYFSIAVNQQTWDSLPQDVRQEISSAGGLEGALFWGENMFDTVATHYQSQKQDYNLIEYTVTPEELDYWTRTVGQTLWDNWVNEMEERGHPEARTILQTCLELIDTYQP